jgi:membrane protease YdiL (CAAX protease family)
MNAALEAWTGLAIVYGGTTLLVSPASRMLGEPYSTRAGWLGNLALWLLASSALALAVASLGANAELLGLAHAGWLSLARAAALTLALTFVFVPLSLRIVSALRLGAFDAGIARVTAWPLSLRVFAVITGGVVEEVLFRACALSFLDALGAGALLAGAIASVLFAVLHWPFWGRGAVVSLTLTSAVLTASYLWQRDLAANALAHVLVDANGLIVGPWLARRAAQRAPVV